MVDIESEQPETVGQLTNDEELIDSPSISNTNDTQPVVENEKTLDISITSELPKDHVDDGGDIMVEGDEDTVIY